MKTITIDKSKTGNVIIFCEKDKVLNDKINSNYLTITTFNNPYQNTSETVNLEKERKDVVTFTHEKTKDS